jgi:hypothetical protein
MTFRWVSQEAAVERWREQQRLLCELEERVRSLFAAVGLPLCRRRRRNHAAHHSGCLKLLTGPSFK